MSLSNLGSVMNQIEGFIASEFGSGVNNNQGLAMFPSLIQQVASRADLTGRTLKVAAPRLFDGTNDVDVSASAAILIGVVAQSQTAQAENAAVLFYDTNTVTEGTTKYEAAVMVGAGGTAATAKGAAVVFVEPVSFATALSWSVVDNGDNGDIEGTGLGDASGVKVMLVYAS